MMKQPCLRLRKLTRIAPVIIKNIRHYSFINVNPYMNKFFLSPLFVILLCACTTSKTKVDLLVINATIYTVDSGFSKTEAMAVSRGKIVATGSSASLQKLYEATETHDAAGKYIYPGFIDAHAHFLNYGLGLQSVD